MKYELIHSLKTKKISNNVLINKIINNLTLYMYDFLYICKYCKFKYSFLCISLLKTYKNIL